MLMTEIRKDSFNEVAQINDQLTDLAERANEILGYKALSTSLGKLAVGVELTTLQAALKATEIDVMRKADVHQYMRETQIEHTKARMEVWLKEFAANGTPGQYNRFDAPAWVRTKISEYTQPVPEFVLAKAVQIKTAVPECEVYIESLSDHPDPFLSVGIPDSKYTWSEPKELYYIEVWDEPKFEGMVRDASMEVPF